MDTPATNPLLVPTLAFALAAVFGATAVRVNFCTMGAVADIVNFGDWRRMRMWLLAIAVAIVGTWALATTGSIDLSKSVYTGTRVPWLSHVVGGLAFGFGMTLASGCAGKSLLRIGTGNLKSLVVMVFLGLAAYMTLKGVLAPLRAFGLDPVAFDVTGAGATQSDLGTIAAGMGLGAAAKTWVPLVVAAALALFVLKSRDFRDGRELLVGGVVIGAVIVGGWYVSGHLGHLAEDPATLEEKFLRTNSGRMESFSYTAPVAYLLELLIYWTDQSRVVTFGIAAVLGMMAGATAMSLATKSFRWEGFASVEDLVNHIAGGLLMGFGGVTALGCTIGQGISGLSTLAVGSIISFFAIVAGGVLGQKYQYWRVASTA